MDLGRLLFDRRAGLIAASAIAIMPVFAIQALDPNVDVFELFFILAGFAALLRGRTDDRRIYPILCGFCFGLALQARETALAAAPVALVAFAIVYRNRSPRMWLLAAGAFALPFALEASLYAWQTGDPFWRRRQSMHHSELVTTELKGRISVDGSPFFNRDLIANWRHEPGISIHWAVDGFVNLVANPRTAGIFLLFALFWVQTRNGRIGTARRRSGLLALAALTYAAILIYLFAIDPKPRMVLPALVATALATAPLFAELERQRPAFAKMTACGILILSILSVSSGYRTGTADKLLREWIRHNGDQIETVRQTRRRMVFIPDAGRLAGAGSGRPLLLVQVNNSCVSWLDEIGIDRSWLAVENEAGLGTYPASWIPHQAHLCLFRYGDIRALPALRAALGPREFIPAPFDRN